VSKNSSPIPHNIKSKFSLTTRNTGQGHRDIPKQKFMKPSKSVTIKEGQDFKKSCPSLLYS